MGYRHEEVECAIPQERVDERADGREVEDRDLIGVARVAPQRDIVCELVQDEHEVAAFSGGQQWSRITSPESQKVAHMS